MAEVRSAQEALSDPPMSSSQNNRNMNNTRPYNNQFSRTHPNSNQQYNPNQQNQNKRMRVTNNDQIMTTSQHQHPNPNHQNPHSVSRNSRYTTFNIMKHFEQQQKTTIMYDLFHTFTKSIIIFYHNIITLNISKIVYI